MIITCPDCGTQYNVPDAHIGPGGRQVRCANCRSSWHQPKEEEGAGLAADPVEPDGPPEPATPLEFLVGIQDLLLADAVDHAKNRSFRGYRREIIKDAALRDLLPDFVKLFDDLWKSKHYISDSLGSGETAADRVRAGLAPALRRAAAMEVGSPADDGGEGGAAESATGDDRSRTDAGQDSSDAGAGEARSTGGGKAAQAGEADVSPIRSRARLVLELAPAAIEGVGVLLKEHEWRLHNRPPEALEQEGLDSLRALHGALGDLIRAAERGEVDEAGVSAVRDLTARLFAFAGETAELCVGGLRPLVASVPVAWGTLTLLEAICSPATYAALGAPSAVAILGGYFAHQVRPR